jgi:hypothetical protein
LEHSSNLYFVNLVLEMSPVTIKCVTANSHPRFEQSRTQEYYVTLRIKSRNFGHAIDNSHYGLILKLGTEMQINHHS